MVGVAQLVEHLVVVQVVAGSSPVTHPKVIGPGVDPPGPITFWDEWAGTREEAVERRPTDPSLTPRTSFHRKGFQE